MSSLSTVPPYRSASESFTTTEVNVIDKVEIM
jgi:hypothetical protein